MEIEVMEDAAKALERGEILALPTDTVWGLMASAHDARALERLYERKGRPVDKPFQVLCASVEAARGLAQLEGTLERDFARLAHLWPGALTLLVPARNEVPARLRPGGVVGLRVPDFHPVQALLERLGGFAACTSFNFSGLPAVTSFEEARANAELYDALWNAGTSRGQASTVFDLRTRTAARVGELRLETLLEALV